MGERTRAMAMAAALVAVGVGPAVGQEVVELERVARHPDGFGFVQTARAMPDGRLLVADPLGRILALVDVDAGTMEPVGREGGGPGEWRQPDAVYALPGDSSLLVDLGNTRLAVLDPAGDIVDSHPMVLERSGRGPMGLEIIRAAGTDGRGRIYYEARQPVRPGEALDSTLVKRWAPGEEPVAVAALTPPVVEFSTSGGANDRRVQMRQIPMAPQDAWAVAPDGRVAVVRAEPYRVEWHGTDGAVVRGPAVEHRPVQVGTAEKERYLDERETEGLFTEMNVENGVRTVGFRRGGQGSDARARARELRDLEWPETLPAIRPGGALVAPDGRLWVRRYTAAGAPAAYDVFDRAGRRAAEVRLPAGRRVIGFQDERVVAVAVDDLGLHWLEVYR